MELLPPPDFFESFDFNFMTTEIFHAQEKELDGTLTDKEMLQLNWRDETNDKDPKSSESLTENQNSPIFGAIGSDISKANKSSTESLDEAKAATIDE